MDPGKDTSHAAGTVLVSALFAILSLLSCKESSPLSAVPEQVTATTLAHSDEDDGRAPVTLDGAGATFPYPIYAKWAHTYNKTAGTQLNYQSIGSGGGIAQIKAKTVDFGATDAPLTKDELDEEGLVQFPMVIGGVVPVVNLDGIGGGDLKLTKTVLADIFLGAITKWNDDAIRRINPGLALPEREIVVVHRADGSGTTWIFTNYLGKISEEWREKVGIGKAVKWPCGMGGKGNEGVASYVQRVNGSIGYVELAYSLQNQMAHVSLQNRDGGFVEPSIETFQAAALSADWQHAAGFYLMLTDQPGDNSWPITGASFILMHKAQADAAKASELLRFFDFCLQKGTQAATDLHYVSMPDHVVSMIHDLWRREIRVAGKQIWK